MGRRIDIASLTCGKCGTRSTPPDTVNAIANEMEILQVIPAKAVDIDGAGINDTDTSKIVSDTEKKMTGNKVVVQSVANNTKVIRLERKYCNAVFDKTAIEDSTQITLNCPQCGSLLYEVRWKS